MATTPNRALRYPLLSNAPSIPQDFQNLATDVDNALAVGGAITCTSSTRPSSPASGVLIWESDTGFSLRFKSGTGGGWRYLGNRVIVADATARGALVAYQGLEALEVSTGITWTYDGTAWWPSGGSTVVPLGKMWGTTGVSAGVASGTSTTVAFNASRTTGGVAFAVGNVLTLPEDGLWEITYKGYATGVATGAVAWTVWRTRSGVADAGIDSIQFHKASTGSDEVAVGSSIVPLKAGDALYLKMGVANATGAISYVENGESQTMLQVRFASPLNGATPL